MVSNIKAQQQMCTNNYRCEISRLVSGSPAAVRNFFTALAAFLVESAKTRVNPTVFALDQQQSGRRSGRPDALGEFFAGKQRDRYHVPMGDTA
jgi:hypothetical protein